jgi:hypothetical protein
MGPPGSLSGLQNFHPRLKFYVWLNAVFVSLSHVYVSAPHVQQFAPQCCVGFPA